MSHPLRIQRKRTKGWKMPEDAVYVGRPGPFGNPFKTAEEFRQAFELLICLDRQPKSMPGDVYRKIMTMVIDLDKLKGKKLACWCSIKKECHSDILAEYANMD